MRKIALNTTGSALFTFTGALAPKGLVITQTDQADPPPAAWSNIKLDEWHLWAETAEKAARQEFVTLIEIDNSVVRLDYNAVARTVGLHFPEGRVSMVLEDSTLRLNGLGVDWEIE